MEFQSSQKRHKMNAQKGYEDFASTNYINYETWMFCISLSEWPFDSEPDDEFVISASDQIFGREEADETNGPLDMTGDMRITDVDDDVVGGGGVIASDRGEECSEWWSELLLPSLCDE